MKEYTVAILLGVAFGFTARLVMLRTDYRQYPTTVHGRVIHLSLGFISAAMGAVAIPALKEENYTAITFLAMAAQQLRDVRNMERQTLTQLDQTELVPRGPSYIEGIAMVFEGRNYLVILTSLVTSLGTVIWHEWAGIALGLASLLLDKWFMSGKVLKDLAEVKEAGVVVDGPHVYVDDIYMMNIGLEVNREVIRRQALGLILTPRDKNSAVTLANLGQRQAILHDLSTVLGVYRDTGEPALVPLIKRDLKTGRLGVLLLPEDRDPRKAIKAAEQVPVLESAQRMPTESEAQGGH